MIMVFDCAVSLRRMRQRVLTTESKERSLRSKRLPEITDGQRETAAGYGCGEIPSRNLNVIPGQFNTSNLV
jgi:hypothetical protein